MPETKQEKQNNGKNILVVEDDEFLSELLGRNLSEKGYELFHAQKAEEAENLLETEEIDLICLDILLPGKDGISFLQDLRSSGGENADIPVLIISNYGDDDKVNAAKEAGVKDYLVKANNSPEEIADKVASIVKE